MHVLLALSVVILLGFAPAFAQDYEILIPQGASDPGSPVFWIDEETGRPGGIITLSPGDSVTWHNADTAFHTVTSVTPDSYETREFEPDGAFDSGFFTAGKSFTQDFESAGTFYYYCSIHPFMSGIVYVTDGVRTLEGVGSEYAEDGLEVRYILDVPLHDSVLISPEEKTVTFSLDGSAQTDELVLFLPPGLVENPAAVWVDGAVSAYSTDGAWMSVPVTPETREIRIMGSSVIPEFGIVMWVLCAGLVAALLARPVLLR